MHTLTDGRFTKAAMHIYLAVFENRDWDRCWSNRTGRFEEWS